MHRPKPTIQTFRFHWERTASSCVVLPLDGMDYVGNAPTSASGP